MPSNEVNRPVNDTSGPLHQAAHGSDRLISPRATLTEGDTAGLELLFKPADADTKDGSTVGENIERGYVFRQRDGVSQGGDGHAARQLDRCGVGCDIRQPREQRRERKVVDEGRPPVLGRGVARGVVDREQEVLTGPDRFEPRSLSQLDDLDRWPRLGEHSAVHVGDAELHDRPPAV